MHPNPAGLPGHAPLLLPNHGAPTSWAGRSLTLGPVTLGRQGTTPANDLADGATCQLLFQPSPAPLAMDSSQRLQPLSWVAGLAGSFDAEAERADVLSLTFPLDLLSRRLANQIRERRCAAQPLTGAAQMCFELGRSCLLQANAISTNVAHALAESLIELAKLAIIEQLCVRRVETVRETVRTRIEAFIQRNLFDPDLSIERVAERMQCTKRYLHKVFSDEGQTLSQYIWAQRLERCRSDLARAELADKSITEIAFAWGFSNAAHFSRSFRARFGQPPRVYRRAVLGA